MPKILIAGCGYVGEATADVFHQAGWTVEGWALSNESAEKLGHKPYPVIAVDIANAHEVCRRPENFDAVIHCASTGGGNAAAYRRVYLVGARNLLDRFVGSTILFTSSTSVYAQDDGSWVTEESETSPDRETGRILLETEKLILSGGGVVARLAGIYGPHRSALIKKFQAGDARTDSENDRFVNQAHRDDIAAALFLLLTRREVRGIYNVVDDEPILLSTCYDWLAKKLKKPVAAEGKSALNRKRGSSNKRVSNSKLRALGWTPKYPTFAEGMERSILPSQNV